MTPRARILAIDDQLYFRSFIEALLSEEGYAVVTAAGGPEGIAALESNGPFDLVIMDLVMPETDGVQTVAEIRDRNPDQDIIVVTGVGDVRAVVSAMQQGAADYLLKPIDRESLLDSIQALLEKRRMRADNARLVGENLEFMGRLSLLERTYPLLGRKDLAATADGLIELLCVEGRAHAGAIWTAQAEEGALSQVVVRGAEEGDRAPTSWSLPQGLIGDALRSGEVVATPAPGDADSTPALLIPFVQHGSLVALARLWRPEGGRFAERDLAATQKLAEIGSFVISNAARIERLEADSLRDGLSGRPSRGFLEEVLATEIQKAHRYGRRLSCLCAQIGGLSENDEREAVQAAVEAIARTLRTTDVFCSEAGQRLWVLVTDTDLLGAVVLKRRLADRISEALRRLGSEASVLVGTASYPLDGRTREDLLSAALASVEVERSSVAGQLGIHTRSSLAEIGRCLLERATRCPTELVSEVADLLIGELACRPRDRGLLFLAPGEDRIEILSPLASLGDVDASTEVFLSTDGDTVPSGPAVTAVMLPPEVPTDMTWIVRFGEAPPYALVAGPPDADGTRAVYHSADPVLVEHMTFRLRAEVGFGVRA